MKEEKITKSKIAEREEEILKFWKENKIFEKSLEKNNPKLARRGGRGEFVFYDGPPFATGLPHYGSLLSSIIKDVIPRYKTMQGFHVRRRWGWDCHGLPIESLVEKNLGLKTKKDIEKMGVGQFNREARNAVLQYADDWEKYIERIGRWVEFKNAYKTMDNSYIESVWWALSQMHEKGLLYEGRKVLMYCPHCETPLAKAEIAMDNSYKDITEEAVTVKFKIKNPKSYKLKAESYLLAWTTTPWTLPGNVALAVSENIKYKMEERNGENFILAGEDGKLTGKDLVGLEYEPLFDIPKIKESDKAYKVYAADFVNTEEGTGIVHTAVMYGEDDFNLGQKIGLPMVPLLDAGGKYNENAPEFLRGLYIKKAEAEIKDDLGNRGLLFEQKNHTHSYPHCYRCGAPLIYNAVSSWFINIQKIKSQLLKLNEEINWVPGHLKYGRFQNIVENAPDWTISRNRYWASPLPIWKNEKTGVIKVIGSVEELKKYSGGQLPLNEEGELDLHRPYIDEVELIDEDGNSLKRVPEVVDCWVESGSMPFAEWHYPMENKNDFESRLPADFIAEYIAQTRTWFYYTHALGVALFNQVAFKNVVTTGTVLAADGSKMSKSKGNYTDPLINLDKFSADALRFYLMGSVVMQAEDLNFRDEELREAQNRVINILWNCLSFFEMYTTEKFSIFNFQFSISNILDKWIVSRLNQTIKEVTEALDNFDTISACRAIRAFVEDFSTWYLRRSRDRFKSDNLEDREQAIQTAKFVLLEFSKVIAPIMPFMAEHIFQTLKSEQDRESVHLCSWPKAREIDEEVLFNMEEVRRIVSLALEKRNAAGVKVRQPLSKLKIGNSKLKINEDYLGLIRDEINVKEIEFNTDLKEEVELDTEITDELKKEGSAREFVRAVQELRKEKGLKPSDSAELLVETDGGGEEFINSVMTQIKKSTNLSGIDFVGNKGKEVEVDGMKFKIELK